MASGRAIRLERVLGRSLRIWARGVLPFTVLSAVPCLPLLASSVLIPEPRTGRDFADFFVANLGTWVLWLATPAAVIHRVLGQLTGERMSLGGCLRAYVKALLPVLGIALWVGLSAIACLFVCGLGLTAALGDEAPALDKAPVAVLGALLSCFFWVAVPVATVERLGIQASIRRSVQLTRGARGTVFAVSAVTLSLVLVPLSLAEKPVSLETLAAIVASGYGAVACAVGYHDLREAQELPRIEEEVFA